VGHHHGDRIIQNDLATEFFAAAKLRLGALAMLDFQLEGSLVHQQIHAPPFAHFQPGRGMVMAFHEQEDHAHADTAGIEQIEKEVADEVQRCVNVAIDDQPIDLARFLGQIDKP
jgi:hypothetical protein